MSAKKPIRRRSLAQDPLDWWEQFTEYPSSMVLLSTLGVEGANPFHLLKLLWAVPTFDPVGRVREDLQDEANRLLKVAQALEEAASVLTGAHCQKDLEVAPSQLRSVAEQIREVFHPVIHSHSNLRRSDSTDYLLYSLYAYLKRFRDLGLYDAIAVLVDAAGSRGQVSLCADAVRKRIKRLEEKDPMLAEQLDGEQETYVREGNGGYDLRERIDEFVASQCGCDIETVRKYRRKH